MWFHDHKWGQFWFSRFAGDSQTFSQLLFQVWHGLSLSLMGQNNPEPPLNITYQTHMEDIIQWSGGITDMVS
jgi:hypothetical protein